MANYTVRGLPAIKLTDLLKKKRTNLKDFLKNSGIATYVTLQQKCSKMGVSPPDEEDFKKALGTVVSSPQEGLVVLEPPSLTNDAGQKISVDSFVHEPAAEASEEIPAATTKLPKRSKKFESSQ